MVAEFGEHKSLRLAGQGTSRYYDLMNDLAKRGIIVLEVLGPSGE
jgi:hypothetical protein